MNKKLIAATVATMVSLSIGSAFANPVDIDGTASFRYRTDTNQGVVGDQDGTITKIVLNAKTNLNPNFDVYARLGVEGVSNAGWNSPKDFNNTSESFVSEIDQFGVIYKNAGYNYTLGRQTAVVGATELLYSNSYKVGKNAFVDGVTVTGKSGITSFKAIAAKEDASGSNDNKIYAISASYQPLSNLTVGTTLAKYDADQDTNHWAVNASYTDGKANYFGEYTQSNVNTDNKGYDLGVSYSFDKKNSTYVIYNKVEQNGDIGGQTYYEPNGKAMYYGFDHKFDKETTGSLFFRDRQQVSGTADDNTSFRATVTYKF